MTILINGTPHQAVNAYSCGPGEPFHTFDLAGGGYVQRIAGVWTLFRPRPVGPVGRVTVAVPHA